MSKKQTTSLSAAEQVITKNVSYRLLAVLIMAVCAVTFFLPLKTFVHSYWATGESGSCLATQNLIATLSDLLKSGNKLFGVLPVLLESQSIVAMVADFALYALIVALAIAALLSFIAIFTAKKAPALTRAAAFLLTWATGGYFLSVLCISLYVTNVGITVDVCSFAITVVGAFFFFILMLKKLGKTAWGALLHLLLSIGISGLLLCALTADAYLYANNQLCKLLAFAIMGVAFLGLFVATCRAMTKKFNKFDIFRFIVQLCTAIAACFLCVVLKQYTSILFFGLVATILALLQLVIAWKQQNKEVKAQVAESLEAELAEFQTEEYIEAYAYEGGPVAGVELAEEVNPTAAALAAAKNWDAAAQATMASLLGNGFDPFLITLTEAEKEQFIDLYVLKCKGLMPEIPGYVVGGDNKDFFNKVFIYLGQYREKIPAGLLAKMYKFSMKI